jgi:hypothetical protein
MFSNLGNPLKWGNDNIALSARIALLGHRRDSRRRLGRSHHRAALRAGQTLDRHQPRTALASGLRPRLVHHRRHDVGRQLAGRHRPERARGRPGQESLRLLVARALGLVDGELVEHIYRKLVDPNETLARLLGSDLVRRDARGGTYPGRTNADLVWLLSVPSLNQLWVVIPFCNAAAGAGFGSGHRHHQVPHATGGFTRQVFLNKSFTSWRRRQAERGQPDTILFVNSPAVPTRTRSTAIASARRRRSPAAAPMSIVAGEYSPFGPDGSGVCREAFLTLSWENVAALPVVVTLTPFVDQQQLENVVLSIQAAAPGRSGDGDLWLDTSNTDTNLGNSTAGAYPAAGDYVLKRWMNELGQVGDRARRRRREGHARDVPIAFRPVRGTRIKFAAASRRRAASRSKCSARLPSSWRRT